MASKYNVGDLVHCYRKRKEGGVDFNFIGRILSKADVGFPTESWEYDVEDAPLLAPDRRCLIWESEITGIVEG